jgi:hypothetical protein
MVGAASRLALIAATLQERPYVIAFVLELIGGFIEESPLP